MFERECVLKNVISSSEFVVGLEKGRRQKSTVACRLANGRVLERKYTKSKTREERRERDAEAAITLDMRVFGGQGIL